MPPLPGTRKRDNGVFGITTDNPLAAGSTTFNSNELVLLPQISGDHAIITLDPIREFGNPEIVVVTAHTVASTSAIVNRGQYGTTARNHPQGTSWVHAPVDEDFVEVVTSGTRPTNTYQGQLVYETDTNRWASFNGSVWLPAPHNVPTCRVYNSVNQSLTDATETTATFNSERFDTDSMHSTAVNTGRITFNTAGVYLVTFNATIQTGSDYNLAFAAIRLNGTTYLGYDVSSPSSFAHTPSYNLSTAFKFSVGDYVEARVYQDNTAGASRTLTNLSNASPEFSATWIGVG